MTTTDTAQKSRPRKPSTSTAILDAPPVTSTRSAPAPAEPVDIVDRVAGRFVDALRAAHEAVERMHGQSRSNPTPAEMLCFRAAGWDQLTRPGQTKWQRQLRHEAARADVRDVLSSPVERQEEIDDLAGVTEKLNAAEPGLLAEIAKLQAQLDELQRDVDDAQRAVSHRETILQRAADPRLLPEYVEADFTQARAAAKRAAAFAPWWSEQGRCDHIASILTRDPTNHEDCVLLRDHILRERPEAIKQNKNNEICDVFIHEAIVHWFTDLRAELAEKSPVVEQGRRELAEKLAEIDRAEKTWFVNDADRRLAEQTK